LRRLVSGSDVGGEKVADPVPLDDALAIMSSPAAGVTLLDANLTSVDPELVHLVGVLGVRPADDPEPVLLRSGAGVRTRVSEGT
jgi:hypothetical protein